MTLLMQRVIGILILAAAITWSGFICADEPPTFTPAHFDTESKHSIDKQIVFPETDGDVSVLLRCDALIKKNGRKRYLHCAYPEDIDRRYMLAVERAAKKARFAPATVNGKKRRARLQFIVKFEKEGASQRVRFYPNWGVNFKIYGSNYSGAQVYDKRRFPRSCATSSRFSVRGKPIPPFAYTAVLVDADGTVHDYTMFEQEEHMTRDCLKGHQNYSLREKYVPAFHDGIAVDSVHLKPLWCHDGRCRAIGLYEMLTLDTDSEY